MWWLYVNLRHRGLFVILALHAFGRIGDGFVRSPSGHSNGRSWRGARTNHRQVPYVWVRPRNRSVDMTGHLHGPAMELPFQTDPLLTHFGVGMFFPLTWAVRELAGPGSWARPSWRTKLATVIRSR